jgi:hypothetical protein
MKKFLKLLLLAVLVIGMFTVLTGCIPKPFDEPTYIELTSSQTGILVPLDGDNSQQGSSNSMEMLQKNLVSDKRIQIPHRWVKTGRNTLGIIPNGKYVDTHKLLIVERKPETREWVGEEDKGTAAVDQGIETESMDSIGFEIGVGITAMIKEEDAVLFLNSYSNKPLASILDQEVRTRVESKFNEEFGMLPLEAVMASKATILNSVKEDVVAHFAKTGITITNLGMKGQLSYSDPAIQNSINEKFQAEKEKQKQVEVNAMNEAKAQTDRDILLANAENEKQLAIVDAETLKIRESVLEIQMKLKELEIKETIAQRWNGTYPDTLFMGNSDAPFLLELPVGK